MGFSPHLYAGVTLMFSCLHMFANVCVCRSLCTHVRIPKEAGLLVRYGVCMCVYAVVLPTNESLRSPAVQG